METYTVTGLLGSHIPLRSEARRYSLPKSAIKCMRNAHVNKFDLQSLTGKHDVTRLDVLMDDLALMQMINPTDHLTANSLNHFYCQPFIECDEAVEVAAVTILKD